MLVLLHDFDLGQKHLLLRLTLEGHPLHRNNLVSHVGASGPNRAGGSDTDRLEKRVSSVRITRRNDAFQFFEDLEVFVGFMGFGGCVFVFFGGVLYGIVSLRVL